MYFVTLHDLAGAEIQVNIERVLYITRGGGGTLITFSEDEDCIDVCVKETLSFVNGQLRMPDSPG